MYSAFFGLRQEPFRLTPDPRFLHLAETHRNTLRAMLEGISMRKGLQVSIGPVGTGKTTLLYCLQHILLHESNDERPIRTAFLVNPVLSPDDFFEALFDELEIAAPGATKPARLRKLHELLLESQQRNGLVLIVIDESHLLSPELLEEIRLLLNLDNYSVSVLQVILCGQPEFVPLLLQPRFAALRGRVAVVSKLRPLTFAECRAYIAERLHIAGLRGENPFTTAALEEIQGRTNGVPRLINSLADKAMLAAWKRQMNRITPELVSEGADELALADALSPEIFGNISNVTETIA